MSWNSTIAGSAAPLQRTSCRTLTKTSLPVRPSLVVTSAIVDVRSTASPTRTGEPNSHSLPSHIPPVAEDGFAGATLFGRHVGDRRRALDRIADPHRRAELELAACPHPARQ